jgi:hypothetical protein
VLRPIVEIECGHRPFDFLPEDNEDAVNFRQSYLKLLPLIQFNYSRVNPVPVKSLAKALGLPAGNLRKPYLNMTGKALRRGVEIASYVSNNCDNQPISRPILKIPYLSRHSPVGFNKKQTPPIGHN